MAASFETEPCINGAEGLWAARGLILFRGTPSIDTVATEICKYKMNIDLFKGDH